MNPSTANAASRLKNEGVNLIEHGLNSDAIIAFKSGLTLVKQVLALLQKEDEDEIQSSSAVSECTAEESPLLSCEFRTMHQDNFHETDICKANKVVDYCEEEAFVFKAPIFISSKLNEPASFAYNT